MLLDEIHCCIDIDGGRRWLLVRFNDEQIKSVILLSPDDNMTHTPATKIEELQYRGNKLDGGVKTSEPPLYRIVRMTKKNNFHRGNEQDEEQLR